MPLPVGGLGPRPFVLPGYGRDLTPETGTWTLKMWNMKLRERKMPHKISGWKCGTLSRHGWKHAFLCTKRCLHTGAIPQCSKSQCQFTTFAQNILRTNFVFTTTSTLHNCSRSMFLFVRIIVSHFYVSLFPPRHFPICHIFIFSLTVAPLVPISGTVYQILEHVSWAYASSYYRFSFLHFFLAFTARCSYASSALGIVILSICPSVHPSVRLSVTRVLCDETKEHIAEILLCMHNN